jgi:drug/metabolite transporter (DMT)-like permease
MLDYFPAILLSLVAILWGTTNALMKKGAEGIERCSSPSNSSIRNFFQEIKFLAKNWKYLCSYGVNQIGSLIYYYSLGFCDLSIAGPLTNTMTFVVTYFADGYFFGKSSISERNIYEKVGLCSICLGVLLCLSSSS